MNTSRCLLPSVTLALLLAASTMHAQSPLKIEGPAGGEQYYPSDSIHFAWSGGSGLPVRVEVENEAGRRWLFDYASSAARLSIRADSLPTGRYRTRLLTIRRDSSVLEIPQSQPSAEDAFPTCSPVNHEFALGCFDGRVRFWDLRTGALTRTLAPVETRTWQFTGEQNYSADGRRLLLRIWDRSRYRSCVIDASTGAVLWADSSGASVSMSPDARLVSVGNVVRRMDDGRIVVTVGDTYETPAQLHFSPDARHAVSFGGGIVTLWSLETGRRRHTWYPLLERELHDVVFSPDGRTVYAVGYEWRLHAFDVENGTTLLQAQIAGTVFDMDITADGHLLALGHVGEVGIYEARTGRLVRHLRMPEWYTGHTSFAGDHTRLVASGANASHRSVHFVMGIDERIDTLYSEGYWSVLPARVTFDIQGDFGPTIVPPRGVYERTGHIRYQEVLSMRIRSARIVGPDSAAFRLARAILPKPVTDGLALTVAFGPRRLGDHHATLELDLERDTVRVELSGRGVTQPVQPRIGGVLFGQVPVAVAIDTVVQGILENVDSVPHRVTISIDSGGVARGYTLLEGGGTNEIPPGGTWNVHLRFFGRFASDKYGVEGSLIVRYDGFGDLFTLIMRAVPVNASAAPQADVGHEDGVRVVTRTSTTTTLRLDAHAEEIMLANVIGQTVCVVRDVAPGEVVLEHGALRPGLHWLFVRGREGVKVVRVW